VGQVTVEQGPKGVASCVIEGRGREVVGARMLVEAREVSHGDDDKPAHGASLDLSLPKRYLGSLSPLVIDAIPIP
jgi:hypothetical protein